MPKAGIGGRLLPSHYATALGNLFRRKGRLILTQAVLVTARTLFLAVMSLSASVTSTLDQEFARRHHDTTMTFEENQRTDRVVSMALSVDGVEKAEVWPAQPARILRQGQPMKEAGVGSQITGVPAGSATYRPLTVAGRWLQPGDDGGSHVIVMDEKTAIPTARIAQGAWSWPDTASTASTRPSPDARSELALSVAKGSPLHKHRVDADARPGRAPVRLLQAGGGPLGVAAPPST